MALRKIVMLGDPVLRQKAKRIHRFDASLQRLANEMFETMHEAHGVGLAAPQIGLSIRLFVAEGEDEDTGQYFKLAMVNPEFVKKEGEQIGMDGCLSIPGYYAVNVRRAQKVEVKGQDLRGKPIRVKAEGYYAWVLQHEIDHLDGILYLDLLDQPEDLREAGKEYPEEEVVTAE